MFDMGNVLFTVDVIQMLELSEKLKVSIVGISFPHAKMSECYGLRHLSEKLKMTRYMTMLVCEIMPHISMLNERIWLASSSIGL